MEKIKHEKCQMDKLIERRIRLEEGLEPNMNLDLQRSTLKKVPNW